MGFLSNILRFGTQKKPTDADIQKAITGRTTVRNAAYQQLYNTFKWFRHYGIFDEDIKTYVDEGYVQNPHIYTCINQIIRPAASVPWKVYKVTDDKKVAKGKRLIKLGRAEEGQYFINKGVEETEGTFLNLMIDEGANEFETWNEFVAGAAGFHQLTGNNFIYGLKPYGFKEFSKIYNLPSQLTKIIPSGDWKRPVERYEIANQWQTLKTMEADEVCHRKMWNPQHDQQTGKSLYGLSPMAPLCRITKRSNESIEASYSLLHRGFPTGIVGAKNTETGYGSDEVAEMKAKWQEEYGGGENKNKPMFTNVDLTWVKLGMSSVELELIEGDKHDIETIARVFGVPLPLVSADNSSYNNIVESKKMLWTDAVLPELTSLRDRLNTFLIPDGNLWLNYDLSGVEPLQMGQKEKVEWVMMLRNSGLLTGKQTLEMLDQEIDDMDNPDLQRRVIANNLRFTDEEFNQTTTQSTNAGRQGGNGAQNPASEGQTQQGD